MQALPLPGRSIMTLKALVLCLPTKSSERPRRSVWNIAADAHSAFKD